MNNCNEYIKKAYVINELNGEAFKLGKWEKDVICSLMSVDFKPKELSLMEKDQVKLGKIIEQLKSEDDKKRLAAGEVVPSWYIGYCWNTCFESQAPIENQEENSYPPTPLRAVQCRTLKNLQEKGLLKVESLGLVNRKFYGLTPEGLRIVNKLTS